MTAKELVTLLKTQPLELTVVTEGYETGYEPIKNVIMIKVDEYKSHEWWEGKYEKSDKNRKPEVICLEADVNKIQKSR